MKKKKDRGETFVGFRPTFFKDKSKYDRNKRKNEERKEIKDASKI